eukprot:6160248-Pyramimonas_sp.AAC.1
MGVCIIWMSVYLANAPKQESGKPCPYGYEAPQALSTHLELNMGIHCRNRTLFRFSTRTAGRRRQRQSPFIRMRQFGQAPRCAHDCFSTLGPTDRHTRPACCS